MSDWHKRKRAHLSAYMREYSKTPAGKLSKRLSHIKSAYGLTKDQYFLLLQVQHNACFICEEKFDDCQKSTQAHVDHCHETGRVRGLLCCNCNTGLGMFKDRASLLEKAAAYLGR